MALEIVVLVVVAAALVIVVVGRAMVETGLLGQGVRLGVLVVLVVVVVVALPLVLLLLRLLLEVTFLRFRVTCIIMGIDNTKSQY